MPQKPSLPDILTEEQMNALTADDSDPNRIRMALASPREAIALGETTEPLAELGDLPEVLNESEINDLIEQSYRDPSYVMSKDEFASWKQVQRQKPTGQKVSEFGAGVLSGGGAVLETVGGAVGEVVGSPLRTFQNSPATVPEGLRRASIGTTQILMGAGRIAADHWNQQTESAQLEEDFQRYLMDKGIEQETLTPANPVVGGAYGTGVLGTGMGAGAVPAQANEVISQGVAMVADPVNLIPLGAVLKTGGKLTRTVAAVGTEAAARAVEATAGGLEGLRLAGADRMAGALERVSGIPAKVQPVASAAAAGTLSQFAANGVAPALTGTAAALASLPAASAAGGLVLRRMKDVAGGVRQFAREARHPIGAERMAVAMDLSTKEVIPLRYRAQLAKGGIGEPLDSVARRLADNQNLPSLMRNVAKAADRPFIVAAARGVSGAVGGATEAAVISGAMAPLLADDPSQAGAMVGGAMTLAGPVAGGMRVFSRNRAQMQDLDVARMLVDVEAAGGDVGALASKFSHENLVKIAGMQGILGNAVDVIPLRGPEYVDNLRALNQETAANASAGAFVDGASGKPRIFVNLDSTKGAAALPHEFGHALLKSPAISDGQRGDIRGWVSSLYGSKGVFARGHEYARKLTEAEWRTDLPKEAPDNLSSADFKAVEAGKKTFEDIHRERKGPVTELAVRNKMRELSEQGTARGDLDPLDWARDEIFAEQWSQSSARLNFDNIRRGAPYGTLVSNFVENILGAQARVLEMLGVEINRQTGAVRTELFANNPLVADSPKVRSRLAQYASAHRQWLAGIENDTGQRGTRVAPSGKVSDLKNNPTIRLRETAAGIRENGFLKEENGKLTVKAQRELDAVQKSRSEQMKYLVPPKMVSQNSGAFGMRRKADGGTEVSGTTLPPQFDFFVHVPAHQRQFARILEGARTTGNTFMALYHSIGKGDSGAFKVANLGNIEAIHREVMLFNWSLSARGNLLAHVLDVTSLRGKALKALNEGKLEIFDNDLNKFHADLKTYLANHAAGQPGSTSIGERKRDAINALIMGRGTRTNQVANPMAGDFGPQGAIRTFRLDRLEDLTATGREGFTFDYPKTNANLMPDADVNLATMEEVPEAKLVAKMRDWKQNYPDAKSADEVYPLPPAFTHRLDEFGTRAHSEDARRSLDAFLERHGRAAGSGFKGSLEDFRAAVAPFVRSAVKAGRVFSPNLLDLVGARGGEHEVILFPGRVLKFLGRDTAGGVVKFSASGEPSVFQGMLPEYMAQIDANRELIGDDVQLEGIMREGKQIRVVTSQPTVKGRAPTYEEAAKAFMDQGFMPVDQDYVLGQEGAELWWNREKNIAFADAKPANLVMLADGRVELIDVKAFRPSGNTLQWMKANGDSLALAAHRAKSSEPKFSKAGGNGLRGDPGQALDWVGDILHDWKSDLNVVVHSSADAIPDAELRQSVKAGGSVEAFFNPADGAIHLLGDRIPSRKDAERLLRHEGMHWAISGPMQGEYAQILGRVAESMPADRLKQIRSNYPGSTPDVWLEEFLAYEGQNNPTSSAWQSFVYEVKRLLQGVFGDRVKFTDADVMAFLAKANGRLEAGK